MQMSYGCFHRSASGKHGNTHYFRTAALHLLFQMMYLSQLKSGLPWLCGTAIRSVAVAEDHRLRRAIHTAISKWSMQMETSELLITTKQMLPDSREQE